MDRALLAAGLRARAERQHRLPSDRRLDLGARVQRDDRVGLGEEPRRAPSARSSRAARSPRRPRGRPSLPRLVRRRMRAERRRRAPRGRTALEPAVEERRARRARPSARSRGRGSSAGARRAPRSRAPRRTRRSSRRRPTVTRSVRDPVQLDRLACLELVPDEQAVRVLVLDRLAGEVVPAPDEHHRREAERPRRLDHVGLGAAEQAARDDQHRVDGQPVDRVDEGSFGRDQLLEVAEGAAGGRACTSAGSSKSAARAAIRFASRVADELQQASCRPSPRPARVGELGAEVPRQIGRGAQNRHRLVRRPQRQVDGCDARPEALRQPVRRRREHQVGPGVEQLEEKRREALHGRGARDDQQARRPGFHRPTG